MANRDIFNKRLQQILRPPDERTPIIKTIHRNPLSATRCMLDVPINSITNPLPRDDAYMMVRFRYKEKILANFGWTANPLRPNRSMPGAWCFTTCARV